MTYRQLIIMQMINKLPKNQFDVSLGIGLLKRIGPVMHLLETAHQTPIFESCKGTS
jgi:hypothetical protein